MIQPSALYLACTTVADRVQAEALATQAVERALAGCVQIEGPFTSIYTWQGNIERAEEFRLCFKCRGDRLAALEQFVLAAHTYEVPEWVYWRAEGAAEKYLNWLNQAATSAPFSQK